MTGPSRLKLLGDPTRWRSIEFLADELVAVAAAADAAASS